MAKVTGPLLSMGGTGTIAKTQTYAKWRGVQYVRQRVVPANPQSTEQTITRSLFAWLSATWKYAPTGIVSSFDAYAAGQPMTGRNAWIKANLANMRGETDLDNLVFSIGAKGGLPPTSIATTAGADQITITLGAPTLPNGWSIVKAHGVAILQQDPQTEAAYAFGSAEDASAPYAPIVTGLTVAAPYWCGGFFEFLKADGTTAWGASLQEAETPS